MDWQVGDLAVCVDARVKPWLSPAQISALGRIQEGCSYRVRAVGRVGPRSGPTIMLCGVANVGEEDGFGWTASRFRKIRPDEPEACWTEFRELLDSFKPKVPEKADRLSVFIVEGHE